MKTIDGGKFREGLDQGSIDLFIFSFVFTNQLNRA